MNTMRTINMFVLLLCSLCVAGAVMSWNSIEHKAATKQLRLAAAGSDAAGVGAALKNGALVTENVSANSDTSILVQQIRLGNKAVVNELLSRSRNIDQPLREIALATALKQPDGELLNVLLSAGWKPGANSLAEQIVWLRKEDSRLQQLQSHWPDIVKEALHISLHTALKNGSLPQAERAIAAGATLDTVTSADCCFSEQQRYTDRNGNSVMVELKTPYGRKLGSLQAAASKESSGALIQFLLAQGLMVDGRDSDGKTALMWALWERNFNNAKVLLKAGAAPNAIDKQGRNAMTYAVLPTSNMRFEGGFITMGGQQQSSFTVHGFTDLLSADLDPSIKDGEGKSALDYAELIARDKTEQTSLANAWARYQAAQKAVSDDSANDNSQP